MNAESAVATPASAPASALPQRATASRGAAWAALPLALLRGALDLVRPGRLFAWLSLSLAAAALPTAVALWSWDVAVAWAQGDLLASPIFAWWLGSAERAGMGGLRAMLGPLLILALWWPAVLGLVAWVQRVAFFARPAGVSRVGFALRGAALVLGFWLAWLLMLPFALWLILLPFAGVAAPLLAWGWLLRRLAGPVPARIAPPVLCAAGLIALASVLPPLALAAPLWLARTAEQLRARVMTETGYD